MQPTNWLNLALYLFLGILLLRMRKMEPVRFVILMTVVIHGLLFNGIYLYRDLVWESCPPVCGLQEWAPALRLHALLAIILSVIDRLVKK